MTHRIFDDPTSIDAKQHLLDNRCERNHPKRHRTRRRSAKLKIKAKKRAEHKRAISLIAYRRKLAMMRSYWRGERDDLP